MTPTEHILELCGKDLFDVKWLLDKNCNLQFEATLSPFHSSKTYRIFGDTDEFDIPMRPPGGSAGYFDANEYRAIRLIKSSRAIQELLQDNWPILMECDPTVLSSFILQFCDSRGPGVHAVFSNASALRQYCDEYPPQWSIELDEREFDRVRTLIGTTALSQEEDTIVIRAITVHKGKNLGVEQIRIPRSCEVGFSERQVLSANIFNKPLPLIY